MIGWAGARGVRTAEVFARHALVLAGLGQGDFEGAYQHAAAMSPAGTLASHVPHCLWVVMDLVEAAVRTHRQAEADRHVRAMQEAGIAALSPRLAILAAASAAIAAGDDRAPALFEQALALPSVDQWPFDVARVRLAYGERLRRARAATESRVHLQAALAAFEKLGAAPWASRAERELRATGQTRMPSGAPGVTALTPQELQIARLAASGLTNKQIAERLYLSPDSRRPPLPDLPQAGHHDPGRPSRRPQPGRQLLLKAPRSPPLVSGRQPTGRASAVRRRGPFPAAR